MSNKQVCLFWLDYMNHNENEDENEKQIKEIRHK